MFLFSFKKGLDTKHRAQDMTWLVYQNCESETLVQLRSFKYVVKCPLRHGNVQKEIDTETKKAFAINS